MKHPNPRLIIPVALVTALGVGGWYVERQRDRVRSTLSGFFESQPAALSSRIGGRVERILVREGDRVRAGQPLIVFEAQAAQAETDAKQALVRQAEERRRQAENGPRPEDIQRQAEMVVEAQAALQKLRNGPLPEEIAAARARLRQAEMVLARLQAGARPEEIAQAQAAERVARARLAQSERGLTPEERAQFRARLEAAQVQETWAGAERTRMNELYAQGAVSKQQMERATTEWKAAQAKRREMEEALRRVEAGTPAEEMEQAREAHRQAQAALELILAGARQEDIEATRAEVNAARQNLLLLLRGARQEDIRAAEARVRQAKSALDALRAGTRVEEIRQAQAAERSTRATALGSRTTLEERILRAPQDGIIERVQAAVGDLIPPGASVIRMTDPADIWLRVYVPEAMLAKINLDSPVELLVDGVPERLPARIESIATQGEFTPANLQTPDERGKQVFAVRLRLIKPDMRVKAGMSASVKRVGQWP
jgi:multidrug resistance efflux pump